jgi:hypothetical protein
MKKRRPLTKKVFEGYTTKDFHPCWTVFNTLNLAAVIQKTRNEAWCRYDDGEMFKNVIKVRVTVERIQ